jgi:hypothetical protein
MIFKYFFLFFFKFFQIFDFLSYAFISCSGESIKFFPAINIFNITGEAWKKLLPALKVIDLTRKLRVFLLPAFGVTDKARQLRKMLFPTELVIFIAHHDFRPEIRFEFVDLHLLGDSFVVRLRVRENVVDGKAFNRITLRKSETAKK